MDYILCLIYLTVVTWNPSELHVASGKLLAMNGTFTLHLILVLFPPAKLAYTASAHTWTTDRDKLSVLLNYCTCLGFFFFL